MEFPVHKRQSKTLALLRGCAIGTSLVEMIAMEGRLAIGEPG
jgi:hypothetical protein